MKRAAAYNLKLVHTRDIGLQVISTIEQWCSSKGIPSSALNSDDMGHFASISPGETGEYRTEALSSESKHYLEIVLQEPIADGAQLFETHIRLAATDQSTAISTVLRGGFANSRVAPLELTPKCPRFIKELLARHPGWTHEDWPVQYTPRVHDIPGAEALVDTLQNPKRSLPVLVLSTLDGKPADEKLASLLSRRLTGLAHVVEIDDTSSWVLTSVVGKNLSTYLGALRIYWPGFTENSDRYAHPLWTHEKLKETFQRQGGPLSFADRISRLVCLAAAGAVHCPSEIPKMRAKLSHQRRQRTARTEDDNTACYLQEIERLESLLEKRDQQLQEAYEGGWQQREGSPIPADREDVSEQEDKTPGPGSVKYYKKLYSAPTHDALKEVSSCNHNKWESAHKADKAKKGIEKLEGSRQWKKVEHCASCTGGGRWKVTW